MTKKMPSEAGSLLEARLERGSFEIDLRIEWAVRNLVLFGPSGSGKTTLMRILLGLEPRARARVRLDGHWLEDPDSGLSVPTHERGLGWVPQSATLFPDRNVARNIGFGAHGADAPSRIAQAVEVLELGDLLARSVASLSGGERQRVALARAIAAGPRALLLDEPLASLDLGLRARVLPYLVRIRDELALPLVHITHDPDEAILLGDEIVVLDRGRAIAQGTPRETLWSQAVQSLATRLEVENVLSVRGAPDAGPSTRVVTESGTILETPWPVAAGEALTLGIRAEDILIALERPGRISARNLCAARVTRITHRADHALVQTKLGEGAAHTELVAKLTVAAVEELELAVDSRVYLIMKSQALRRIG